MISLEKIIKGGVKPHKLPDAQDSAHFSARPEAAFKPPSCLRLRRAAGPAARRAGAARLRARAWGLGRQPRGGRARALSSKWRASAGSPPRPAERSRLPPPRRGPRPRPARPGLAGARAWSRRRSPGRRPCCSLACLPSSAFPRARERWRAARAPCASALPAKSAQLLARLAQGQPGSLRRELAERCAGEERGRGERGRAPASGSELPGLAARRRPEVGAGAPAARGGARELTGAPATSQAPKGLSAPAPAPPATPAQRPAAEARVAPGLTLPLAVSQMSALISRVRRRIVPLVPSPILLLVITYSWRNRAYFVITVTEHRFTSPSLK